jgi:hypothetical protein
MQLQNIIERDGDIFKTFVNNIQSVPIAQNFFFILVPWCCFFGNELPEPGLRSADSFNGIGCLSTLYLCNFYQSVQSSFLLA